MTPGRTTRASELVPVHAARAAMIQRKAAASADSDVADGAEGALATASGSAGAPLPEALREKFETSLGADLTAVRVHTGSDSAAAATSVGARAYAVGNDIHFNAGEFDPSSHDGELLLAHEVAHTVQQGGGGTGAQYKLEVSSPGDHLEVEADRAAEAMVHGASASVSFGTGVARKVMRKGENEGADGTRQGRTQVTPGTSNQSKRATPAQIAKLEQLKGVMSKASGKAQVASEKLARAMKSATDKLGQIDLDLAAIAAKYETAYEKHVRALKPAGLAVARDEAIMKAVIGAAIGAAVGALLPAIAGAPTLDVLIAKMADEYVLAWNEAKVIQKLAKTAAGAGGTATSKGVAAGVGAASGAGKPNPITPAIQQLKAVQDVSALKSKVLAAANAVIDIGPLDTAIETTLRDVALYAEQGTGTSVSDPVDVVIAKAEKLAAHAPAAYGAADKAAAAAGRSVNGVSEAFAQAASSATVMKMEQRIWVQWIASVTNDQKKKILDKLNGGLIDRTLLPDHVIRMLGVENGTFGLNDGDLNQQIMNAQLARDAEAAIGKTGVYQGVLLPNRHGVAMIDGTTYSAEFVGHANHAQDDTEEGNANVIVIDTHTFTVNEAKTGTGSKTARKRFGLVVKPI